MLHIGDSLAADFCGARAAGLQAGALLGVTKRFITTLYNGLQWPGCHYSVWDRRGHSKNFNSWRLCGWIAVRIAKSRSTRTDPKPRMCAKVLCRIAECPLISGTWRPQGSRTVQKRC